MVDGLPIHARYVNPIYADQEVIESVLNGDEPTSMTSADRNRPRAFVKVLDDQFEDEPEESDVGEESEDEDEKTAEPGSEGYPPIEVSTWLRLDLDEINATAGLHTPGCGMD